MENDERRPARFGSTDLLVLRGNALAGSALKRQVLPPNSFFLFDTVCDRLERQFLIDREKLQIRLERLVVDRFVQPLVSLSNTRQRND